MTKKEHQLFDILEEFKKSYFTWEFEENHLASKRGFYPHDNLAKHNMSEQGYHNHSLTITHKTQLTLIKI